MIGDWFRFRYTIDGKEIVHTFRIGRIENELGDYYVWGERSGVLGRMCYPERLEPIPLTQEILEKNGFVRSEKSSRKPYQLIDSSTYVSIIEGRLNARCHEKAGRPTNAMQIDCNYVHDLQHALKLCGIDKKIVI